MVHSPQIVAPVPTLRQQDLLRQDVPAVLPNDASLPARDSTDRCSTHYHTTTLPHLPPSLRR